MDVLPKRCADLREICNVAHRYCAKMPGLPPRCGSHKAPPPPPQPSETLTKRQRETKPRASSSAGTYPAPVLAPGLPPIAAENGSLGAASSVHSDRKWGGSAGS